VHALGLAEVLSPQGAIPQITNPQITKRLGPQIATFAESPQICETY
jgi:hypothetical protein